MAKKAVKSVRKQLAIAEPKQSKSPIRNIVRGGTITPNRKVSFFKR